MRFSALILTLNEAKNLPTCLDALQWCDDIVVLDSGSTDETVTIAKSHGARVLVRSFTTFADQRNWGLDHGAFSNVWVLHLDADEVLTDTFREALSALVPPETIDAYRVPSKTMLLGRWLKHAGMYPTYQVRLGRRDVLRFHQVGHGQRENLPPNRIDTFGEPYLHFSFSHGLRAWFEKHARYAEQEAAEILRLRLNSSPWSSVRRLRSSTRSEGRRAMKDIAAWMPIWVRPPARLIYILIGRLGVLDGRGGLLFATMLAIYEAMIAVLVAEKRLQVRKGTPSRAP